MFRWFVSALAIASLAVAQTADTHCNPYFCIRAAWDGTSTLTYTLTSQNGVSIAWAAVGEGSAMNGAKMYMTWPSTSGGGNVVFSERTAVGHNPPTVVSSPVSVLQTSLSASNSSTFQSIWTRPQTTAPSSRYPIIWAYQRGSTPGPSASVAITQQHYKYGTASLDLTKAATSASNSTAGGTSSATSDDDSGGGGNGPLVAAHAIIMIIAWMAIAPAGVLLARFARATKARWVLGHQILNGGFLVVLVLVGAILIIVEVAQSGGPHFSDTHQRLGLVVFILVFIQAAGGAIIHHLYDAQRTKRPIINWAHMVLGMALLALALATVKTGISEYGEEKWMTGLYFAWIGVIVLIFIGGYAIIPRQIKREQDSKFPSDERVGMQERHRVTSQASGNGLIGSN